MAGAKTEANTVAIADKIDAAVPIPIAGLRAKSRAAVELWSSGDGSDEIADDSNLAMLARSALIELAMEAAASLMHTPRARPTNGGMTGKRRPQQG